MKWAGTIEIGVTMHSADELSFPSTMTNVRSGTWMMTGNGIMYNGTTISDEYGCNLDKLKVKLVNYYFLLFSDSYSLYIRDIFNKQ